MDLFLKVSIFLYYCTLLADGSFVGAFFVVSSSLKRTTYQTIVYQLCLTSAPLHIEVEATPTNPSLKHTFNTTVVRIYKTSFLIKLERVDEDGGWTDVQLNVTWRAFTETECKIGLYFDTKCYEEVTSNKRTYTDARTDCQSRGGILAAVKTQLISDFLRNQVLTLDDDYWFGLDDIENEGTFVFSDGTLLKNNIFKNWKSGEPNNDLGNEDCVHVVTKAVSRKWNDNDCSVTQYYICQFNGVFV